MEHINARSIDLSALVIKSIDEKHKARSAYLGSKVGASSVMYCLLQQYYKLVGAPASSTMKPVDKFRMEQGNIMEAALADLMIRPEDDIRVVELKEQIEYRGIRCNPDRILEVRVNVPGVGGDLWVPVAPVEYKDLDTYTFMKIALQGVEAARYEYYVQAMLYASALSFPGSKLFVVAKSPSDVKRDVRIKLNSLAKKPGVEAIRQVQTLEGMDLWSYQEWIPVIPEVIEMAEERASVVTIAAQLGKQPRREYTPGKDWPCNFCAYVKQCKEDQG